MKKNAKKTAKASKPEVLDADAKNEEGKDGSVAGILDDVATGDLIDLWAMVEGKKEPRGSLKVTRVTRTKVCHGSRDFLKTTGVEEGHPIGSEIFATPAPQAKRQAKGQSAKKNAPKPIPAAERGNRLSQLAAAAKVLEKAGKPMNCQGLVNAMLPYWSSPAGKTPHSTLHSALTREIKVKGKDSRFKKADRGLFCLAR
jgi:hypothetical protein